MQPSNQQIQKEIRKRKQNKTKKILSFNAHKENQQQVQQSTKSILGKLYWILVKNMISGYWLFSFTSQGTDCLVSHLINKIHLSP